VDAAEFALRAVIGQQVSTAAARTHAGRLAAAYGEPVTDPAGGLTRLFPSPAVLASALPASTGSAGLGPASTGPASARPAGMGPAGAGALAMPRARQASFAALAAALAGGELDLSPGSDWARAREVMAGLPGLGPWTIESIAMRGLGDPDAFIPGDLGVRLAARALGLPATPAALTRRAADWRPWRAYAVQYLWATGDHAINRLPAA
jgi:AraC family transcriptional regulator of adaptative response / DNA-3-methyladenine glycosylase II